MKGGGVGGVVCDDAPGEITMDRVGGACGAADDIRERAAVGAVRLWIRV
jgi:hypothetical protein